MNGLFTAGGPLVAVLLGFGFGFVLERAGFGSGCKLTAQFRLTDWSVFKVMFTAIVFTAVGIYALEQLGLLQAEAIYVPIPYLWAIAVGGALIGAGFAVGGYCPGTSAVGVMTGRIDAIVFFNVWVNDSPATSDGESVSLAPGESTSVTISTQPMLSESSPVGAETVSYSWNFSVEVP